MTIKISLEEEAARIVERQIAQGHYPDAESAVTAGLLLLEDTALRWEQVDAAAVRRMIADSDAEGGEIPLDEVARRLAAKTATNQR